VAPLLRPLLLLLLLLSLLLLPTPLTLRRLQLRELSEHAPLHHLANMSLELGARGSARGAAKGWRHDGGHSACGARIGQKNQIAAGRHRAPCAGAVLLEHRGTCRDMGDHTHMPS